MQRPQSLSWTIARSRTASPIARSTSLRSAVMRRSFLIPQAIIGNPLLDLVPELSGSERALADLLGGKLLRFEPPRVNHSGATGAAPHLTMVDLPHRDAQGRITGVLHLVQDVTGLAASEQRLIEQEDALRLLQAELQQRTLELTAAQAELQSLSQMKSTFVSTAAHELRSPLTAMTGYLELLQDNDTSNLTRRAAGVPVDHRGEHPTPGVDHHRSVGCDAPRVGADRAGVAANGSGHRWSKQPSPNMPASSAKKSWKSP